MNLKYKELAKQAWHSLMDEMGDVYREDGLNWDFLHAYDKRYAELIIQECMDQCIINGSINSYPDYNQRKAYNECADRISKHFGVKR